MKKILLLSALLIFSLNSHSQQILDNQSVIDMVELGFDEQVIIDKIKSTDSNFDTSIEKLNILKLSGATPNILTAIIQASGSKVKYRKGKIQNITFGAKAGLNLTSVKTSRVIDTGLIFSIHLGVTSEIKVSNSFSIQPELLYSGQGFFEGNRNLTFLTDYINLPVMAKFYVSNGLSLEAGPQIGYLVSAQVDEEGNRGAFKSSDFALNIGAGYKFDSGLNFSLRYSVGLKDVEQGFGVYGSSIYHRVLQLSVGYNFKQSKIF